MLRQSRFLLVRSTRHGSFSVTTTTMTGYLSPRRCWASSASSSSRDAAQRTQQELQTVIKSTPSTADKAPSMPSSNRAPRYRQALINSLLSFFTVVLAAQGVKNAQAKRKAERRVEALEELYHDAQSTLTSLTKNPNVVVKPLTQLLLQYQNERPLQHGWWWPWQRRHARSMDLTHQQQQQQQQQQLEGDITQLLQTAIGQAALSPTERDKRQLEELSLSNPSSSSNNNDDETLRTNNENDQQAMELVTHILSESSQPTSPSSASNTTIKKQVYAF